MSEGRRSIDFSTRSTPAEPFAVAWIHGSESAKHNTDPDIQVYAYDQHTLLLRQNMAINYEGPFLFLLFGNDRALLIDTGATADPTLLPLRAVVDQQITDWLTAHPREDYGLVVMHTHAHGDHIAGDEQFRDRPDTVVVGAARDIAWPYFGFDVDPGRVAIIDLGGRTLVGVATPGHDPAAVTFFDHYTGILLTGDTVYRGRLYISDFAAFRDSIDRLVEFTGSVAVDHVVGCHIEMTTTAGIDYPVRTTYQPHEPPLQMSREHLYSIQKALRQVTGGAGSFAFDEFILVIDGADDD